MDCPGCVMQIRGGLDKQTLNHKGLNTRFSDWRTNWSEPQMARF
jgi:Fe-S oxidoreductase